MNEIMKRNESRRFAILGITIMIIALVAQWSSGISLYVNGNKIETAPYVENGVTYVPLQSIVEGMGDKYEWNKSYRSATITHGDKKVQLISGKSIMVVNSKYVPIATKIVNKVAVPLNIKAVYKDGVFFVPLSVITDTLGYKVDTSERTNIYVGTKPVKETKPVETPKPVEPPKPAEPVKPVEPVEPAPTGTDIATTDNIQKLVELGFNSYGKQSAFYNSEFPDYQQGADLIIGTKTGEHVVFTLSYWKGKTPEFTKKALNVYLPEEGDTIYTRVNELFNGTTDTVDESYEVDGHSVRLVTDKGGRLLIQIYN